MTYSFKKLKNLAGLTTQTEAGIVLGVSPATVNGWEKEQSVLYFKWLVAEAALRQGVSKREIHRQLTAED